MHRIAYPRAPIALAFLLFPLSLLSAGCNSKDVDGLAELGTLLAQKASALLGTSGSAAARGLQAVPLQLGELAVDARVAARLNWDKPLADATIQVKAIGEIVELHGTVRSIDQRQRAIELAQTTAGVEKVVDRLEIRGGEVGK
jgi:osmotically-inducible protein OsmY